MWEEFSGDGPWQTAVLKRLGEMDGHLEGVARNAQLPRMEPGPKTVDVFAKFPARDFNYLTELDALETDIPASEEDLLEEVANFFRGAQRPDSPYCLFNMNVLPTVDATAAACLALMRNVNGLMDMFSGESLLVEQKVARTVGRWAGWPGAMGIACNGGKVTMQYALRAAISRAQPQSTRHGIDGRFVVLCSAGAHYSVEHVAASVGIGAENCTRVPLDSSGGMDQQKLREAMEKEYAEGATIAAVVCCGGTIVDFCCDDTAAVRETVDHFARAHALEQTPYLHFDSVIGWLYLAFRGMSPADLEAAVPEQEIQNRIAEVVHRCSALDQFDSLGVDFHKTGLCPATSSFFIAPDRQFMDDLGSGDYSYGERDFEFGNFRAYRYTFENSRPTQAILSAWVNLRHLGRQGLGAYLVSLHRGRIGLEQAIERHGQFTVLNPSNLGWEVLFDIPFDNFETDSSSDDLAIAFMDHCWKRVREGHELPLFSIVPEYHIDHNPSRSRIAFLLYPMNEHSPEWWDHVITAIATELRRFQEVGGVDVNLRPTAWERPIR
jgi:glutamate/tyrosine decarboxylase-like PLP-dependent enzyme